MFTTGFIHDPDQTDLGDSVSLEWMKQTAQRKNAAVTGSLAVEEKGVFYNRMYFVTPGSKGGLYDKKHLFALVMRQRFFNLDNIRACKLQGWTIFSDLLRSSFSGLGSISYSL